MQIKVGRQSFAAQKPQLAEHWYHQRINPSIRFHHQRNHRVPEIQKDVRRWVGIRWLGAMWYLRQFPQSQASVHQQEKSDHRMEQVQHNALFGRQSSSEDHPRVQIQHLLPWSLWQAEDTPVLLRSNRKPRLLYHQVQGRTALQGHCLQDPQKVVGLHREVGLRVHLPQGNSSALLQLQET